MKDLYIEEDYKKIHKKNKICHIVAITLGALALILSITLCCLVWVINQKFIIVTVLTSFTLIGCIDIYIEHSIVLEKKRLYDHYQVILSNKDSAKEEVGKIHLDKKMFRIKNGIVANKVYINNHLYSVASIYFIELLNIEGKEIKAIIVSNFIVSFEVIA